MRILLNPLLILKWGGGWIGCALASAAPPFRGSCGDERGRCAFVRARLCFWGLLSAQAMGRCAKLHGQCALRLAIEGLPGTVHAGGVAGIKGLLCALGRTFWSAAELPGFLAVLHTLLVFQKWW